MSLHNKTRIARIIVNGAVYSASARFGIFILQIPQQLKLIFPIHMKIHFIYNFKIIEQ